MILEQILSKKEESQNMRGQESINFLRKKGRGKGRGGGEREELEKDQTRPIQ